MGVVIVVVEVVDVSYDVAVADVGDEVAVIFYDLM